MLITDSTIPLLTQIVLPCGNLQADNCETPVSILNNVMTILIVTSKKIVQGSESFFFFTPPQGVGGRGGGLVGYPQTPTHPPPTPTHASKILHCSDQKWVKTPVNPSLRTLHKLF